MSADDFGDVLAGVGPRLRHLRQSKNATLAGLSRQTGISVSTLSRLESGQRRPTLELMLPIARAHGVPLDDLVGAPPVGDPRVRLETQQMGDRLVTPLTAHAEGLQAFKITIPGQVSPSDLRVHDGYEWLYVLSGRLRLLLAHHDLTLEPGQAAEFDTRVPHAFGAAGPEPAEVLSLFGSQGERMHLRVRPGPAARKPASP